MKQLHYSKLNVNGRLANQLFFVASSYGLAKKTNRQLTLPIWKYQEYFEWGNEIKEGYYPWIDGEKEPYFHYCGRIMERLLNTTKDVVNIEGYFQSEKYFKEYEQDIKRILKWKEEFKAKCRGSLSPLFTINRPIIAIHVRRGDYIGNENYHNLPLNYHLLALETYFPDWMENYNIIVFSDDVQWCKTYFAGDNIHISEGRSDIEDLCLMSQCTSFILSNSSYSWWGAWLSSTKELVIRPTQLFEGPLKKINDPKDFWPSEWTEFNYINQKFPLQDVTFTIPTHYDHEDRALNLQRILKFLNKNFLTNIIVGEQGGEWFKDALHCSYYSFTGMPLFHRTKMLNDMCHQAKTPIIVNYDADVIIPVIQILQSVHLCRKGIGMVFPYDGRFARLPKEYHSLDVSKLNPDHLLGSRKNDTVSVGGCVFFRKDAFIKGGMENENFISYGPEDTERFERFSRIGIDVRRVPGVLYHYDHFVGVNSNGSNPYFAHNYEELDRIRRLSNKALKEDVSRWRWIKEKATI